LCPRNCPINYFGHGVVYTGGVPYGLGYKKEKKGASSAKYADIAAAEAYTLGLVILNACNTDPGGAILATPTPQGGLFAGHLHVMNPGGPEWYVKWKTGEPPPYDAPTPVQDVIAPGQQGTKP
jgi:hypothetical protein